MGWSHSAVVNAVYGCLLMAIGLAAISFSSASKSEYAKWYEAAQREQQRYGLDAEFVSSGMEGRSLKQGQTRSRKWLDWALIIVATGIFVRTGIMARWPSMELNWHAAIVLVTAGMALFAVAGYCLWKATKFN